MFSNAPMSSLGLVYPPEMAAPEDSEVEGDTGFQKTPGLEGETLFTRLGTLWGQEVAGGLS